MEIKEIIEPRQKKAIARGIPETLPEWSGIPQAREQYIAQSAGPFSRPCRRSAGSIAAVGAAREHEAAADYSFLQVKTVQMGRYREFDEANRFSLSLGFREFEVFRKLWDEGKPSQGYVMALE